MVHSLDGDGRLGSCLGGGLGRFGLGLPQWCHLPFLKKNL